jgi:lipoprotein NlpI
MSSMFHSTIICQLEEDSLPSPEFLWNITLNETEFNNLTFERNVFYENDSLRLIGPIKLDLMSTLNVECHVSNIFGNDTAITSISLCGKSMS